MSTNIIILIADWIAANTSFTKGTNLFHGWRPQSAPDRCVLLRNSSGGILYADARSRVDFMLQVLTRSAVIGQAHDDMATIHQFLFEDRKSHVELPAGSPQIRIEVVLPSGYYGPIGQDEKKRHEFSGNFRLNLYRIV